MHTSVYGNNISQLGVIPEKSVPYRSLLNSVAPAPVSTRPINRILPISPIHRCFPCLLIPLFSCLLNLIPILPSANIPSQPLKTD